MTPAIERILVDGKIRTLDRVRPTAEALAIGGGRILAVGSNDSIRALAGADTVIDNLEGRSLLPGLVDAHVHWSGTAQALFSVKLDDVVSRDQAVERVAERAGKTVPGAWITGYGWSHADWKSDPRFPTAHDLDGVTPNHPVMLKARSGHAAWVNSIAMRMCGIDGDTADPAGGQIMRDDLGTPTGVFLEWTAMDLITHHVPPDTTDSLIAKMRAAGEYALSLGLTGIHDLDWRDSFIALQTMRAADALDLRVVKHINLEYFDSLLDLGLRPGFGDDWLRIGCLKLFVDGALGARTASMLDPYDGEPDNVGIIVIDKHNAYNAISRASAAGFAAAVHAIGDRAVRDVLDTFQTVRAEEAARGVPPDARRHRIEHVQLIHPDDVGRLAELSLIASMQPIHATSDRDFADRYWGERCATAYNPRLQLDRGVVVAFSSDSPVDNLDPITGIHAAVTRRRADGSPGADGWYPDARVSIDEAVRAYTQAPAYAAGVERRAGTIAPGCNADLTLLDRDLYTTPSDELLQTQVSGTMVGGIWKYRQF